MQNKMNENLLETSVPEIYSTDVMELGINSFSHSEIIGNCPWQHTCKYILEF
jgi:hypothetical protein